ncbi:MAG: patatin, partial [Syntrophomonadaceae bacterium]|nr:patatin [Syntrophomonadaceae bacterium]
GALAIAIKAANYNHQEFEEVLNSFDFQNLQVNKPSALPVFQSYEEFIAKEKRNNPSAIFTFLDQSPKETRINRADSYSGNILNNIIKFSSEKSLFNGDYLEEWLYDILAERGIRTFGDLKNGLVDKRNPHDYKIRMTCVDCTRIKSVTLPDDLVYYGIDPDKFEVAKAVRISASIPFAFKPVGIEKDGIKYYLIDGGVFDNFPYWLIDNSTFPTIGFRIQSEKQNINLKTPINIIRNIISTTYDIGIPHHLKSEINYIENIPVSNIPTLDFNLTEEAKSYLIESGYEAAYTLFNQIQPQPFLSFIRRMLG